MATIDILMATFNGELYIREQIESLITQTFTDWHLIIHDDGSHDKTLQFIKEFKDNRITIIEDGIRFGSAGRNFMHLLNFSNSPYIMFCDQDDIWFPNKIQKMYDKIRTENSDSPVAVYSRSILWSGLEEFGMEGFDTFPSKLEDIIFCDGGIQGCAAIFNRRLLEIIRGYHGSLSMHDRVLNLAALSLGVCKAIWQPLMYYRQHNENVTGNSTFSHSKFSRRLKALRNKYPVIDLLTYNTTVDFYIQYKDLMPVKIREIYEAYIRFPSSNIIERFFLILKYKFKRGTILDLLFKTILHPAIS